MKINSKILHRVTLAAASFAFAFALTSSLGAQTGPAPVTPPVNGTQGGGATGAGGSGTTNNDTLHDEHQAQLKSFDGFLDKHPEMSEQLSKNPSLANNPQYLASHPELKQYLQEHPGVRQDLKNHPHAFMHKEKQADRTERKQRNREHRENHGRPGVHPVRP